MPNQYVNKVVQSNGTTIIDISDTTAVASDVASGKYFYLATGAKVAGTASGGGTPSATAHTIEFEFTDSTSTTLTGYWDGSFISDAIRATKPVTYNNKQVSAAQLDGVTWYTPATIPIGEELVDYEAVITERSVSEDGSIVESDPWNCVTDYIPIDASMTFTFKCTQYANIGFYDSNKNAIRTVFADNIKESAEDYIASGTLTSSIIPIGADYIVLRGNSYSIEESLSLIRTA